MEKQVILNMTGEQFKKLIEETEKNGVVDTLQELLDLFKGISDSETVAEYVTRKAKEVSKPTYDEKNEGIILGGYNEETT